MYFIVFAMNVHRNTTTAGVCRYCAATFLIWTPGPGPVLLFQYIERTNKLKLHLVQLNYSPWQENIFYNISMTLNGIGKMQSACGLWVEYSEHKATGDDVEETVGE